MLLIYTQHKKANCNINNIKGRSKRVGTLEAIEDKLLSFNKDCFIYRIIYVSPMVTTGQKPGVDLQKTKKGKIDHTTTENNKFAKVGRNKGKNK